MWRELFHKLLFSLLTLSATFLFSLVLMLQMPGDPFLEEQAIDHQIHQAILKHHGLEKPLLEQSWNRLKAIAQFDLGYSLIHRERKVQTILAESFPLSATLGVMAGSVAITGGILWGIASYSFGLRLGFSSLSLAIPSFILAALLQYLFAVEWKLLPIARWGTWQQAILPVAALALRPMAYIAKMLRSNLSETDQLNFILAARTRKISRWRILFLHQLPYAFLPLIGYLSQMLASILVGSFIIEKIFSIPGMGFWFVNGVLNRDYPLIIGTTLFFNLILVIMTLLGELLRLAVDPRQREAVA